MREGSTGGDKALLAGKRFPQAVKLRRDARALGSDNRLHLVLAPGDARNFTQPSVGVLEPVRQRRFHLRHAVLLLDASGEIGQHETHRDRRLGFGHLRELIKCASAHHEIDFEPERIEERGEYVRPAEMDDVDEIGLLCALAAHEPAQNAMLDHIPAARPMLRAEALAIERHDDGAEFFLQAARRTLDVVADDAAGAGRRDEDHLRPVPRPRFADGLFELGDAAERHVLFEEVRADGLRVFQLPPAARGKVAIISAGKGLTGRASDRRMLDHHQVLDDRRIRHRDVLGAH